MKFDFLISLILFSISTALVGQTTQIDELVTETLKEDKVPAISIGVFQKDSIILTKGYGHVSSDIPTTIETHFHFGSITKTFVAIAIMQLEEMGLVDLDKPIVHYIPEFEMKSGSFQLITIRHLLSNSSGMPDDFKPDYETAWQNPDYDKEALKRQMLSFRGRKMLSKPGKKWSYSNLGFELLGYLIERLTDQTFEQYMTQNIFTPLDMRSTTFFYQEVAGNLLAWPHVRSGSGEITPSAFYPYSRSRIPSSDLNTNIAEMKNFSEFVFNKGVFQGDTILTEKSFNRMWSKEIETDKRKFPDEHRFNGLGWFMGNHNNYRIIGNVGGDTGSRTSLTYIPEKEVMIYLTGNSDQFKFWELTLNIVDVPIQKE